MPSTDRILDDDDDDDDDDNCKIVAGTSLTEADRRG